MDLLGEFEPLAWRDVDSMPPPGAKPQTSIEVDDVDHDQPSNPSLLGQLGIALKGLKRFAHAEVVLLEAVSALPASERGEKRHKAERRLVDLYDAWHEAEPDAGHDASARRWRTNR